MVFKIYLAGGMKSGWQDEVFEKAPEHWEIFDPRSHGLENPYNYTQWDLAKIKISNAVLAEMGSDNPSGFGMSLEVGYAHALDKPIVFLDRMLVDWRSRYFDMHRIIASDVVSDIDAAIMYLRGIE